MKKIILITSIFFFSVSINIAIPNNKIELIEKTPFLKNNKDIELRKNESIIKKKAANHLVGNEFVGGKLYLTNQRVVFKSHKLNFNNHQISFELNDIQNVVKSQLFNGMIIILKNGKEAPFVIWKRKKWINEITNLIQ